MTPTFLDLRTGKIAKGFDMPLFWWSEGNGSCDCNRHQGFPGLGEKLAMEQRRDKPRLLPHQSVCYGTKRFIAIDVEGDLEGYSKEDLLRMMNVEYGV